MSVIVTVCRSPVPIVVTSRGTVRGMTDPNSEPTAVGPWLRRTRTSAYANPWIEVFHDEVDRPDGSPGIYGVVHFRNVRPWASWRWTTTDASCSSGSTATRSTSTAGRSRRVGVDDGEPLVDGARRELAEETGYEAERLAAAVPDDRVQLGHRRARRDLPRDRAPSQARRHPRPPRTLAVRWATLDEVLAEIESGEIHDIITIVGVGRYALELVSGR